MSNTTLDCDDGNWDEPPPGGSNGTAHRSKNGHQNKNKPSSGRERERRTRVKDRPNHPLKLWPIIKNCIGKDLTKIPMPVNFSEPLSLLQRLTEDMEYAYLLDAAAQSSDPYERTAYVAAYAVSCYSTTSERTLKPFNPLLGETFECDRRRDLGWRSLAEQVSHHPPISARHCTGKTGWVLWSDFTIESKFRGRYLQIRPVGDVGLLFADGHRYTWNKVTTTVNNVVVGKLWLDQHGESLIKSDLASCNMIFYRYNKMQPEKYRAVSGVVTDAGGTPRWKVEGYWDKAVSICEEGGGKENIVWRRVPAPLESQKYYNLTVLASQLNEPEDGVAPTDSRRRPDQRLMEEGNWEAANSLKERLEENQRRRRKLRETQMAKAMAQGLPELTPYTPLWFTKQTDPVTGASCYVYAGGYWEAKKKKDWHMCPNIYDVSDHSAEG